MHGGFEALFVKYGWVWIGLSFGFLAKYALLIKRGIKVQARLVMADLLLLPLVALIAYSLVRQAGVDGEASALITAFCTVGADRLVKLLTERFLRQAEAATLRDVAADVIDSRGDLRNAVQTTLSAKRLEQDAIGQG